ncbi:MAG: hypothetical protein LAN64_14840 [Acidobacteriia bacterium]|nr:hypothetical protein [Terriglobia bacterium]
MRGTASRNSLYTGAIAIAFVATGFTIVGALLGVCNFAAGAGLPDDRLQHDPPPAAASIAGTACCVAIIIAQQPRDIFLQSVRPLASPAAGIASSAIASTTATATNLEPTLMFASQG